MNKTIERLITAGMIAILATAFFQVAHATNESSYKFGLQEGKMNFNCPSSGEECLTAYSMCGGTETSNRTACVDGWVHGYEDGCLANAKICIENFIKHGWLPDSTTLRKGENGNVVYCDLANSCGLAVTTFANGTLTGHPFTYP